MADDLIDKLSRPFPPSEIEWRVGSTNGDKTQGLALAYLTARHVMERLDSVVGVANWQDRYEFHGSRTVCYLSLRIGDEWVTKADGAGDSDVEAEKGAISDALKRAAVKWGIGRYLYSLGNTWVGVEAYGKSVRIKRDEYAKLEMVLHKHFGSGDGPSATEIAIERAKQSASEPEMSNTAAKAHWKTISDEMFACTTLKQLQGVWTRHFPVYETLPENLQAELRTWKDDLKEKLSEKAA